MGRNARSFDRGKSKFKPQPTMLVICEDSKSGKTYVEEAVTHFRATVSVEHCGNTDPIGIVDAAIKRKNDFDFIYCAIDWDGRPALADAIALVKHIPKIVVIDSHPCFEVWLLLHFKYSRSAYVREGSKSPGDCLIRDLTRLEIFSEYTKGNPKGLFKKLIGHLPTAKANATRALDDADATNELNPSTKFHLLINDIEALSEPKPISPVSFLNK
jgi:hypothetical protein